MTQKENVLPLDEQALLHGASRLMGGEEHE